MLSDFNQKVLILIVSLFLGAVLTIHVALCMTGGVLLVWGLHNLQFTLSFLQRLFSPAPRNAVSKPRPIALCHLYDPETNTMTALPRALILELFHGRRDNPFQ